MIEIWYIKLIDIIEVKFWKVLTISGTYTESFSKFQFKVTAYNTQQIGDEYLGRHIPSQKQHPWGDSNALISPT